VASLKAQDQGGAYAERLALEGGNRFANSIPSFMRQLLIALQGLPITHMYLSHNFISQSTSYSLASAMRFDTIGEMKVVAVKREGLQL
jgi:hypothetical protein